MSLLEMSFAGGVLILAVIVLRALTLHRLPKGTFLALWAVAVLRLLVPISLPSPLSVYTLAERVQAYGEAAETASEAAPETAPLAGTGQGAVLHPAAAPETEERALPAGNVRKTGGWTAVWLCGAALCGAFFLTAGIRCRREFRTALPVEDGRLDRWLADRRLRRTVALRQSDRVGAPLTYGLLRPVILLPRSWADEPRLDYVLEHELAHIRRLDALWKPVLALAACVHWFNPLVWCMFVLANRDMELRCDEEAVRRLGLDRRSKYALTLISMEEKKSGLGPFASAFSQNAIEERITAVMKIRKRSLAALMAAAILVCCVGAAFATSAAEKEDAPYPAVRDGAFTRKELDRLASLWFEGYEDMTVAAYQEKMWAERDDPEDMELIERYGQYGAEGGAFYDYFHSVYEPLTSEGWRSRTYSGMVSRQTEDGRTAYLEYTYTLNILDPEKVTAGEYQKAHALEKEAAQLQITQSAASRGGDVPVYSMLTPAPEESKGLESSLSYGPLRWSYAPEEDQPANDPDAALHAQFSQDVAASWDETLSPYTAFGLTYTFSDPDLDGNGLTMWFQGREVRGIFDEREHTWITEHTGLGTYSEGAVELYAVYTDGILTGLRLATPEEQAEMDENRQASMTAPEGEEQREFPYAAQADYDALLALSGWEPDLPEDASHPYTDYRDMTLAAFNQRLLDWANENGDAWDRINCDVVWDSYGVELEPWEKRFASLTCWLSGTENGQMIRALHTGGPEEDPRFSASMPERVAEGGGAWCDLYYSVSYHVSDKSAATVGERDGCVGGMMDAVRAFWQDTDLDTLLGMTEEDMAARFNAWAAEVGTENVRINPVTVDDIHFERYDERDIA